MGRTILIQLAATALLLSGLHSQAQAGVNSSCFSFVEKLTSRNSQTLKKKSKAPARLWAEYYKDIRTPEQLRGAPFASVDSPDKFLGLVLASVRNLPESDLLTPGDDEKTWSRLTKRSARIFERPVSLKQIQQIVFSLYEAAYKPSDPWFWPTGVEDFINRRFIARQIIPQVALELQRLSVAQINPADLTTSAYSQSQAWFALGRFVLGDAALIAMKVLPAFLPSVQPIQFTPIPDNIDQAINQGNLALAQELGRHSTSLKKWGVGNGIYKDLRKACMIGAMSACLWFGASHAAQIEKFVQMATVSDVATQQYEAQTYSKDAVVSQQMQMWLDARPTPPTAEEMKTKQAFYEDQERRDVLRMYSQNSPQ